MRPGRSRTSSRPTTRPASGSRAERWPEGPECPHCGTRNVQSGIAHKTMTHRCRECEGRPMFSLRTGTVMQGSNLGYRVWGIAIYLVTTGIKGTASMKIHRDADGSRGTSLHSTAPDARASG